MSTKVEVARLPFLSRSQAKILAAIPSASTSSNVSPQFEPESEDERAPLLQVVEGTGAKEPITPTLRPKSRLFKKRKDKELVQASKLASDIALRGQNVRPASFLSRTSSRADQDITKSLHDHSDTFVRVIEEEGGYVIDGRPEIMEWSLDDAVQEGSVVTASESNLEQASTPPKDTSKPQ